MAKKFNLSGLIADAEQQYKTNTKTANEEIIVLEEFKNLIPPLSQEELYLLEESILTDGCRDALIVWEKEPGTLVLIDGHNRYAICSKHGVDFKTIRMDFSSEEEAVDWMVNNQLGKRNVSDETKSYLRGIQYKREKNKSKFKGNQYTVQAQDKLSLTTAERLAEQHKVSDKTIKRDEKFADLIDGLEKNLGGGIKNKILNKVIKISKSQLEKAASLAPDEQKEYFKKLETGEKPVVTKREPIEVPVIEKVVTTDVMFLTDNGNKTFEAIKLLQNRGKQINILSKESSGDVHRFKLRIKAVPSEIFEIADKLRLESL